MRVKYLTSTVASEIKRTGKSFDILENIEAF